MSVARRTRWTRPVRPARDGLLCVGFDVVVILLALRVGADLLGALTVVAIPLTVQVGLAPSRLARRRPRITFVCGMQDDAFTENLLEGCRTCLEATDLDVRFERASDTSGAATAGEREANMLRALSVSDVDAVLLRPSEDRTADIFQQVSRLTRSGVRFVILGDAMPDEMFTAADVTPPLRAFTAAREGAEVLIDELARRMRTGDYQRLVFLAGPISNEVWRSGSRVAVAIYLMARDVRGVQFEVIERTSSVAGQWPALLSGAGGLRRGERVLISVNSDGTSLREIAEWLRADGRESDVDLIGYGGARTVGGYVAFACGAVATVDLQPHQRGHRAAQLLLDERRDVLTRRWERVTPLLRRPPVRG